MLSNKGFFFTAVKPFGKMSEKELFLLLLHVNARPPHIAICYDHYYYSLTVKGPEIKLPFANLLRLVKARNIPTLLIRLNQSGISLHHEFITAVFSAHPALKPGRSCLQPVTELAEKIWGIAPTAPLIFGLLEMLHENKLPDGCFQLNMQHLLEPDGSYLLKRYSPEEVADRIAGLESSSRK